MSCGYNIANREVGKHNVSVTPFTDRRITEAVNGCIM